MDFINRSTGTILENNIDLLFNLFLVKHKARKSILIEITDLPTSHTPTEYFDAITTIYNEFIYTSEHYINETLWRFFASSDTLDPIDNYKTHDIWVATMLEFNCKGIPDPNIPRYVLRYSVQTNSKEEYINFYSEICKELDTIKSKKLKFYKQAKKLNWNVKETIEPIYPDSIWLLALINRGSYNDNKNWLKENYDKFLEFMEGWGLSNLLEINIDDLFSKYYNWALFTLLRTELDPISPMYPLTNLEADKLTELDNAVFSNNSDPMIAYISLLKNKFIKKKISELSAVLQKRFDIIKNKLFVKYNDILELIRIKNLYNLNIKIN